METIEEKLARVKRVSDRKRLALKTKQLMWENSLAKEAIKQGIMIAYVRDKFGFKKGVVVAIGPGELGWSMVDAADHEGRFLTVENIPILAKYLCNPDNHDVIPADAALDCFVHHPAFKAWEREGGYISVPLFDRARGIEQAVNRARAIKATPPIDRPLTFEDTFIPRDKELRNTMARLNLRSFEHFNKQEASD
jgi:hypothetical protein